MGVHDPDDRALAQLVVDEVERGAGRFLGRQRVEDDPAGLALDEGDVGQVKAAHLIDLAWQHLVQSIGHVQHGLALERWMDAGEVLALQQPLVAAHVPGHMAGIGLDLLVRGLGDEALLGFIEIALVLEGQRGLDTFAQFNRECCRKAAIRVEMASR